MRASLLFLFLALSQVACELDEVSLTVPEEVLVAEIYVVVGDFRSEIIAFLHETLGSPGPSELRDATIRITADTLEVVLVPAASDECLAKGIDGTVEGACFAAPSDIPDGILEPGVALNLEISTPDGRELRGNTLVPEEIRMIWPPFQICALVPERTFELIWTRSPGAWAYAAETEIWGLRDAYRLQGIEVSADSVALLGLAVSDSDTTIVFPSQFGVFDRFDLDSDLALALQEGIPYGSQANVVVAALDRNYVNWVRGGNFNPSGQVRVPSLRGDGIGVFASLVRRTIRVEGIDPDDLPGGIVPGCVPGS